MVNINSIEGIESLIDKRTKPLKEEILKLRFELEELKQALTIPVVVESACFDYQEGINMDCSKCGQPKYLHK